MNAEERRAEKRVRPPGDALLDFALWPASLSPPPRLPLSALGPPAACLAAGDRVILADIAAIGLGLRLVAPPPACDSLGAAPAVHVYLKLRDYRPQAPTDRLSVFFHASAMFVQPTPAGLGLGLRILRQGHGSSFEKALELLDVSRFGVPELVPWIDALVRQSRQGNHLRETGLDLDVLLEEPELALLPPIGKGTEE